MGYRLFMSVLFLLISLSLFAQKRQGKYLFNQGMSLNRTFDSDTPFALIEKYNFGLYLSSINDSTGYPLYYADPCSFYDVLKDTLFTDESIDTANCDWMPGCLIRNRNQFEYIYTIKKNEKEFLIRKIINYSSKGYYYEIDTIRNIDVKLGNVISYFDHEESETILFLYTKNHISCFKYENRILKKFKEYKHYYKQDFKSGNLLYNEKNDILAFHIYGNSNPVDKEVYNDISIGYIYNVTSNNAEIHNEYDYSFYELDNGTFIIDEATQLYKNNYFYADFKKRAKYKRMYISDSDIMWIIDSPKGHHPISHLNGFKGYYWYNYIVDFKNNNKNFSGTSLDHYSSGRLNGDYIYSYYDFGNLMGVIGISEYIWGFNFGLKHYGYYDFIRNFKINDLTGDTSYTYLNNLITKNSYYVFPGGSLNYWGDSIILFKSAETQNFTVPSMPNELIYKPFIDLNYTSDCDGDKVFVNSFLIDSILYLKIDDDTLKLIENSYFIIDDYINNLKNDTIINFELFYVQEGVNIKILNKSFELKKKPNYDYIVIEGYDDCEKKDFYLKPLTNNENIIETKLLLNGVEQTYMDSFKINIDSTVNLQIDWIFIDSFCSYNLSDTLILEYEPKSILPITINLTDSCRLGTYEILIDSINVLQNVKLFKNGIESNFLNGNSNDFKVGKNIIYYQAERINGCITKDTIEFYLKNGISPKETIKNPYASFTDSGVLVRWGALQGAAGYRVQYAEEELVTTNLELLHNTTESFEYSITAIDSCGNMSQVAEISPIYLTGSTDPQNFAANLRWSSYPTPDYCVERLSLDSSWENLGCVNLLTFSDEEFAEDESFAERCYRVRSVTEPKSYSNVVCLPFVAQLWIPNAFSPNADGINDVWQLRGIGIKEIKVSVYNRWGQLVYEGGRLSDRWDGANAQEGVYLYIVQYQDNSGRRRLEKGVLRVLR
jgi:gliding motility-associated-like protein